MKAFEVTLNRRRLCTAGIYDNGVLSAIVSWVGRSDGSPSPNAGFHFTVGALDSSTGEHLRWAVPMVEVGDEITSRIVETDEIDPQDPRNRISGWDWRSN
ncbi:MAG TPA: hypothetical protein VG406_18120 [Isosphaeraceae bacterium]|jgi:hypothetical protein|nr:hypothetical protein [Isosphaeraceae bacterium]